MTYCQIDVTITTNYVNRRIRVFCEGTYSLTEAYMMLCAHVAGRIRGNGPLNQFDYWHNYRDDENRDQMGWTDYEVEDSKHARVNWTCLTPGRMPTHFEHSSGHISLHAFDRPPEGIYY